MFRLAFDGVCWLFVILIPLLGAWTASSLAAYFNGPVWLVATAGLLGFPILPVAWELWAARRKRDAERADEPGKLSWGERLTLRTLVINLAFLVILLASTPQAAFTALSARGDWFLDGRHDPPAERARELLFWSADRLEWLHALARENPYRELADTDGQEPRPPDPNQLPEPTPQGSDAEPEPSASPSAAASASASPSPSRPPSSTPFGKVPPWPLPPTPHPLAKAIPAEGVEAAARYAAEHEKDPVQRFRALHDFVVLRTAYDAPALAAGLYPPQDAATVLKTKVAVCAGYANLLKALGQQAGLNVVVVTGDSREMGGEIAGGGHAWNAVELHGAWYLVDPTWNAGYVEGARFVPQYGTEYLFTPPRVFAIDHLPDQDGWQLLRSPISRGEFTRQPLLRPGFFAAGLELLQPRRSQVTVPRRSQVVLDDPRGVYVLAELRAPGASDGPRLPVRKEGGKLLIDCELPRAGTYQVHLFIGEQEYGRYRFAGQLELHGG